MIDRITILGGSSVYTPEFISSMISSNLSVKEIVLVGRPGPKLPLVAQFCQRMLDRSGFPATVIASTDTSSAVAGAKYVLNHVRVGGMPARIRDEKTPPKFGMVGDETLGAGGFANAMRTLPVTLEHARIIEEVNPSATFINLTNPMGIVVEALIHYSKLNVIGVCDLPGSIIKKIAEVLRHAPGDLSFFYLGLNHIGWIQDIKLEGRSCMARALERIEQCHDDGFDLELLSLFRMIPTSPVGLFFHQDAILKKQLACGRFRAEVLHEAEQQILKLYEDESLAEVPDLTRQRNAVWYGETIVPLIVALESKTDHEFVLCVRNEGSIRDLPDDCSVEIPVTVSRRGLKPHKVGSCPRFLRGLYQAVKESDRLAVEAVRHKSYDYALQSLTIHPLVPSLDAARRFLDRIIKDESLALH
ncbi:MAG: hypothetical protein HZB26_00340 [Candidatus Hydrogenedentes bacterium]|nr:hypothetical protein [Candidatus Hydrogenedentota bacterium]